MLGKDINMGHVAGNTNIQQAGWDIINPLLVFVMPPDIEELHSDICQEQIDFGKVISILKRWQKQVDTNDKKYLVIKNAIEQLEELEQRKSYSISQLNKEEELVVAVDQFPDLKYGFHNQNLVFKDIVDNIEIERIFYISAPAGYGKSAILKKISANYADKGYQCLYIHINHLALEKEYSVFGRNRVFLFDSLENASPETLVWLKHFLYQLKDARQAMCYAVLAGRYLDIKKAPSIAKTLGLNARTHKKKLSTLTEKEVYDFIRTAHSKSHPDSNDITQIPDYDIKKWANRIAKLSCGHPGIIKALVDKLSKDGYRASFASSKKEQQDLFKEILEKHLIEIFMVSGSHLGDNDADLADKFIPAFEQLSIFSRFNLSMVEGMKKLKRISNDIDILLFLTEAKLICERAEDEMSEGISVFYTDALVRKLLLKKMELFSTEGSYLSLLKDAKSMLVDLVEECYEFETINRSQPHEFLYKINAARAFAQQYLYLSIQEIVAAYPESEKITDDQRKKISQDIEKNIADATKLSRVPRKEYLIKDEAIEKIIEDYALDDFF
ncbi:hypothetical protein [Beggiatoa leptomitoformis]|uniref:Uncharacterized protein n=1 Tax=Beggiatoa leptomitoformis TaxID=288004 RepID=A0A2N9YBC4_9GAMM|nr:hypothetical protein [Beggiatoa leptomitoformis]ALG66896.1 hypothetical protein AL038_03145 [Beggiatoa leptomitoformis]AUI67744.2 hypothetical protein BLE401_02890 [Beggiatoa leptomitoformis]